MSLEYLKRQLTRWAETDDRRRLQIVAGRGERELVRFTAGFGGNQVDKDERTPLFAIASITKAIVSLSLVKLMEIGACYSEETVARFWPEFGQQGKDKVSLKGLLTHTSGIPRDVPNDLKWRENHETLTQVANRVASLELEYTPGTQVRYASPPFLAVQMVVEKIAEEPLFHFLEREIFTPIGASSIRLGFGPTDLPKGTELVPVVIRPDDEKTTWHWNSDYYRRLGAPWGGMIASADDLKAVLQAILMVGPSPFKRGTVKAMLQDHTEHVPSSTPSNRSEGWGLGWRLNKGPKTGELFGDQMSPRAFGHLGATGTAIMADQDTGFWMVFLANHSSAGRWVGRAANALVGCLVYS